MRPIESETIVYEDVTLVVSEATVGMGMVRSRLKINALNELGKSFDPGNDQHIMQVISYPDVMGALVDCQGMERPENFAAFLALPDALMTLWVEATYRLNPHWLDPSMLKKEEAEAREKKDSSSSSGSSGRRRHRAPTPTPS